MHNIYSKIKNNWILFIIILQPILDIVSYFQSKYVGSSFSWIARIAILVCVFIITFINSKNRKKLILCLSLYALFFIIHILNLYRVNHLNILLDVKYFILVFQLPVLSILLIDYIKSSNYDLNKIKKAILYNFLIITVSIFISYITNTYENTYVGIGVTGWFSSANTQSMILCALAPWVLYMLSNSKKPVIYGIGCALVFIILYTNATRACYLTLVATLLIMFFALAFSKKEEKKLIKIIITSAFILLAIFAYKFSFTSSKEIVADNVTESYTNDIKTVITEDSILDTDFNNINLSDDTLIADILKLSYLYTQLMNIHGEQAVVDIMKPYLSASALSNNRLIKVLNAKIEFNNSDILTKTLGIGYSRIQANQLDLENDLQAIYYYYGYLGFLIYASFISYFIIKLAILFCKNPSIIHDKEYIILAFLVFLLLFGGEYSGAFLRKSNANIYLSLYLLLIYFKLEKDFKKKSINNKKITFLLLHLGYGGIETSTINTANALSEKYDVELISFYNLKENQEKYINKNIQIKYLYNGGPNKEEFSEAIKQKNIIKILKEGFKAVDILLKKKYLIKEEILNSDSFAIISTRYDFSRLLSKYGHKKVIKIAQEHHHHNNNKKYINILKKKYKNIDYLFALTPNLKYDYEKFLAKNKKTKVVVVPNMIDTENTPYSYNLDSKNIISICRLHEGKRINELIEMFSKLKDKDSKLYIIGDGEEKSKLETQIKELNLENRVIMTGYLDKDEQKEYLLNSSVYAMTSISEGLPMVLLEAMSFGIPCIAYQTDSGVADIITDNKNGFIIKNRDQSEYIEKLSLLLKDIDLKEKMRKNCIDTCKKYSKNEIIKIWETILKC